MLIHGSIHFSVCFTQWMSLNTSCRQREWCRGLLGSVPDTIQLHHCLAHQVGSWGYKIVFVWLNIGPFELRGGSFPLALSYNCMQSIFLVWFGIQRVYSSAYATSFILLLKHKKVVVTVTSVTSHTPRHRQAQTGTHRPASFPAHAHKMGWLEGKLIRTNI